MAESRLLIFQRNPNGTPYGEDPYTIAFTKVGSCRELSNMFSYMAKRSGIESRTVQTAWDHQWAEVKIDGEWLYYDPWCAVEHGYYNSTDGNLTFKNKWFNKIEYFRDNCHDKAYLNTYNEYPWVLASIDYSSAYFLHDLNK
jgi:transglutaminase-like putative cysteine protease